MSVTALIGGVAATPASAAPTTVTKAAFGTLINGTPVDAYTLTNSTGMSVTLLTYGGIIQQVRVPDRKGKTANVTLGFSGVRDYQLFSPYFGCITGRYANRIAKGQFTLLGKTYQLPLNNGVNTLHGGTVGFDKQIWGATVVNESGAAGVRFTYVSPNGDQGYPGTLTSNVTYLLSNSKNSLKMRYRATTDAPTIVNLTNHAYWNLKGDGRGSILDHVLALNAQSYTPVDATLIPTGEIAPVVGTPMDFFTKPHAIGERINDYTFWQLKTGRGYDHNWVIDRPAGDTSTLVSAAKVMEPTSGRTLEVLTTEPGIQFYSGNFLDGTIVGGSGRGYRQGDGFALETQRYPDTPNHPNFPSATLMPGAVYQTSTVYAFGVS